MPITLDSKCALVVIDLQLGLLGLPTAHPIPPIIANAAAMARAFRKRGAPVALVNVAGRSPGRAEVVRQMPTPPANWAQLVPELDAQPSDILVTKYAIGAFIGTSLDFHLRRAGVTQIVLCGIATGSGVESTARSAHDLGYTIAFVTDAMTDMSAEVHAFCLERVFPRLGEMGTTADVLALSNR
jgi:nicotinamidase-related amidase